MPRLDLAVPVKHLDGPGENLTEHAPSRIAIDG
jgi:hypothetical protein